MPGVSAGAREPVLIISSTTLGVIPRGSILENSSLYSAEPSLYLFLAAISLALELSSALIPRVSGAILSKTTGDTLVVTRMDRIGRNTIQLLQLVEQLREKDVHFAILNLGIDTRTPTGKFFLTVMAAFSELNREMIKEKQRAGIKLAKQKGVYRGRLKKYTDKHPGMNHAIALREHTTKTVKEICQITGVSQAALYRRLKELE